IFLDVDAVRHSSRKLYSESIAVPGHKRVQQMLLSPDGKFIAFDRLNMNDGDGLGIWLLDVRSGKCFQATFEASPPYSHNLIRWDSPTRLEFLHYEFLPVGRVDSLYALTIPSK